MFVPDLDLNARSFVRVIDVEVMEPLFADHVPTWWQHDDPAVIEFRKIVLNAAIAESVIDAMLLRFAGQVRICDIENTVALR